MKTGNSILGSLETLEIELTDGAGKAREDVDSLALTIWEILKSISDSTKVALSCISILSTISFGTLSGSNNATTSSSISESCSVALFNMVLNALSLASSTFSMERYSSADFILLLKTNLRPSRRLSFRSSVIMKTC